MNKPIEKIDIIKIIPPKGKSDFLKKWIIKNQELNKKEKYWIYVVLIIVASLICLMVCYIYCCNGCSQDDVKTKEKFTPVKVPIVLQNS